MKAPLQRYRSACAASERLETGLRLWAKQAVWPYSHVAVGTARWVIAHRRLTSPTAPVR